VSFEVTFEEVKWWDSDSSTAVGIRFHICGAAEERARHPKLVFMLGTCRTDGLEEQSKRLGWC